MLERLCQQPNDVLHFDDKTLTNNYRLLNKIIRLCLFYYQGYHNFA